MRLLTILLLLIVQIGFAQSFEKKHQLLLPVGDIQKMLWADVNNDSLLDVVVSYKTPTAFMLAAIENNLDEDWDTHELVSVPLTVGMTDEIDFQLVDSDEDGMLDIVVENEFDHLAQHYRNAGNFQFTTDSGWGSREVTLKGLIYADLNNNAANDTIWTEGATLSIMNRQDTTLNKIESVCVWDFDNNGFKDIAFSGINTSNQPITFIWYFGNYFNIMDRELVTNQSGQLSTGDLNHDGRFDLIIAGKNGSGIPQTSIFENSEQGFTLSESATGLENAEILIADFSSDGLADISFRGTDGSTAQQNWIKEESDSINLFSNTLAQAFGDYDRDGDLDWAYTKDDSLYVFSDQAGHNNGPGVAFGAIALPVYDKLFFYWDKSEDDHTPQQAITYDLKIYTEASPVQSADFLVDNYHRVKPSHGNMGTNNFMLLNIQPSEGMFEIQTIDNAFMTRMKTICRGGFGGASGPPSCEATSEIQEIVVCGDAPVVLTPPAPQAMWFSFTDGFRGVADSFTPDTESDTIFSFNPTGPRSCASLRIYNIKTNPTDTIYKTQSSYHCKDENTLLEIAPEWSNVSWRNNRNANIVNAQSVNHMVQQDILFTAIATNTYGCALKETHQLFLSEPIIQLSGAHFQIIRGSEVQLEASGGETYLWTPTGSLSDNHAFNPLASPEVTTEYHVTVTDSIGCEASAKVLVEVLEEAFIPTMFTPNGDGRNDLIKIYGLTQAIGFKFAIFNREGAKLFETTSVSEATQSGWSGQVNGMTQPPGTYYWKVEGKMPKGEVLLNGKKNGAFLLVR